MFMKNQEKAFVNFSSLEEADNARKHLNQVNLFSFQRISVNYSKIQTDLDPNLIFKSAKSWLFNDFLQIN